RLGSDHRDVQAPVVDVALQIGGALARQRLKVGAESIQLSEGGLQKRGIVAGVDALFGAAEGHVFALENLIDAKAIDGRIHSPERDENGDNGQKQELRLPDEANAPIGQKARQEGL